MYHEAIGRSFFIFGRAPSGRAFRYKSSRKPFTGSITNRHPYISRKQHINIYPQTRFNF
jgi:hypothetical protein